MPWFNNEIKAKKQERRNLENSWRKIKQSKIEKQDAKTSEKIESLKNKYKKVRTELVNMINFEKRHDNGWTGFVKK